MARAVSPNKDDLIQLVKMIENTDGHKNDIDEMWKQRGVLLSLIPVAIDQSAKTPWPKQIDAKHMDILFAYCFPWDPQKRCLQALSRYVLKL
eukprot:374881_1